MPMISPRPASQIPSPRSWLRREERTNMDRGRLNHSVQSMLLKEGGRSQKPQRLVNERMGAQPKAAGHR
eukprot:1133505-Pyramimonas_sp.AAC.1